MILKELIKSKNISVYKLAKDSNIPYMTLNDIINGKTNLTKCSTETTYKLAKSLNVSMEDLVEPLLIKRISFDLFKSNVCHDLKNMGDLDFIIKNIENDDINKYYKMSCYPECFYLLAMIDYLSRINNIPLCDKYNELRNKKLEKTVYPTSILASFYISNDKAILDDAIEKSIPEFMKYNIMESEIRNVI